jgi:hypothetical protein
MAAIAMDKDRLLELKTRHQGGPQEAVVDRAEFHELLVLAGRGLAADRLVEALEGINSQALRPLTEARTMMPLVFVSSQGALKGFEQAKVALEVPSLDNQEPEFYEDPDNFGRF